MADYEISGAITEDFNDAVVVIGEVLSSAIKEKDVAKFKRGMEALAGREGKIMEKHGFDLNSLHRHNTPFIVDAAVNECVEIIDILAAQKGFNIEQSDGEGNTAFIAAAKEGKTKSLKALIKAKKVKLDPKNKEDNIAAIKVKLDSKNWEGNTAAIVAAENGKVACLKLLIKAGANLKLKNREGNTPLIAASKEGKVDSLKVLIKVGVKLNLKNKKGNSALSEAVLNKKPLIMDVLIAADANLDIINNERKTALMLAAMNGDLKFAKKLMDAGAKIDGIDGDGQTAIALAREKGFDRMVNLIKNHTIDNDPELQEMMAVTERVSELGLKLSLF